MFVALDRSKRMRATTKRALSLLLASSSLVASLVIFTTLILPEYRVVTRLRGELASKSDLLEKQQTAITQVQGLIAKYQGVAKLGESLSLALPNEESVASIMAQINAISRSSGVVIRSVGISYPPPTKPKTARKRPDRRVSSARDIGTLKLELDIVGNYSAIKKFLKFLETNIRIMDTRSLTINQAGKSDQDIYNYSITVDTYYQPQ